MEIKPLTPLPPGYTLEGPEQGYIGWILYHDFYRGIRRWDDEPTHEEIMRAIVMHRMGLK